MKIARLLYVLGAVVLSSPALAAEGSGRNAAREKSDAIASTHASPAKADHEGKLRCTCAPMKDEQKRPEPVFTDAG